MQTNERQGENWSNVLLTIHADIPSSFESLIALSADVGGELIIFRPNDEIACVSSPVARRYSFCTFNKGISFTDLYWGVLTHGFVDAASLPLSPRDYLRLAIDVRRANETLDFQKAYGETRLLCHHRRLSHGWSAQLRLDLAAIRYAGSAPLSVFDAVDRHREVERLTAALDHLPVSVVFVGSDGRVRWKNASATTLLSTSESICVREGLLTFDDPTVQLTFSRAIAFVLDNGETAYITLPLTGRTRLLSIATAPFPGEAMVFFAPDDQKGEMIDEALAVLGLSPAERRVAVSIGSGDSPGAISAATGRANATVRRQLADIYRKLSLNMGVTSQRDLARLVAQVASIAGFSRKTSQ